LREKEEELGETVRNKTKIAENERNGGNEEDSARKCFSEFRSHPHSPPFPSLIFDVKILKIHLHFELPPWHTVIFKELGYGTEV
jgi:hypothetical protein